MMGVPCKILLETIPLISLKCMGKDMLARFVRDVKLVSQKMPPAPALPPQKRAPEAVRAPLKGVHHALSEQASSTCVGCAGDTQQPFGGAVALDAHGQTASGVLDE